ncbi:hypothetical protein ASPACDRAFT_39997 [Aspergillus aculeatus ATCC 16872]|uniref:Zn(2)-C6 fungal-type domain-containing protein n=1 Tax=Aspergillus aculeatus (strain ATCC 16872 / CBS 172.66 / WB 5094) TaxID=690307 RepID=A0A1L9X2U5_ASPA1|nr:uncharacterized protein ASPACDRAFT_39997 [Aspergillus aculeatus ATCC 16872]OJK02684.1 hypothetical protein ASPACDRAFT_39997 [Aspergillus aculeatus ATCC 16872]
MSEHGVTSYRPIAPKAAKEDEARDPPPVPESGKTRRASTACYECQRLRTRCTIKDTGIPCTQCRVHGRSCEVNESKDKRRKAEQKRTEELLRVYKSLINGLMEIIRIGDGELTREVLSRMRQPTGLIELQDLLSEYVTLAVPEEEEGEEEEEEEEVEDEVISELESDESDEESDTNSLESPSMNEQNL